ncbi:MAG: FG-GAP repeat domain-containing protein, partial [Rhodothermales bacterium]
AYFVGNYATNNMLVLLNNAGQIMYQFELTGTPVATRVDGQRLYILMIGQGPEPRVTKRGAIYVVTDPEVGPELVLDGLSRPVDFELADLNSDGLNDFVVCEYGHYSGALSWFEQNTNGSFVKHVLKNEPGAIAVELHDFDKDGLLDLGVLMSQGDEGIDIHFNKGNGVFEEKRILRFPPVYGSSSFSLVDFNEDGKVDILYTNGDNADSSPVLKNYHGIRIFQAWQAGVYEEVLFYPLHGAISAQAADFDQNGHLDIAAISYFPDYTTQPVESFVLLMDEGQMNYTPHSFDGAVRGRWFVMDVGDIDGDADVDIILGSNIGFGPRGDQTGLFKQWEEEALSYVILQNERL